MLLNILQQVNGSIAWENLLIVLAVFAIGYWLRRWMDQRIVKSLTDKVIELEATVKKQTTEFKSYRNGHEATYSQGKKTVSDMTGRVKSLEGDIRVLSEQRNQLKQQLEEKETVLTETHRKVKESDAVQLQLKEKQAAVLLSMTEKLDHVTNELLNARAWEVKARKAAEETRQVRLELQQRNEQLTNLPDGTAQAARITALEKALTEKEALLATSQNELNALKAGLTSTITPVPEEPLSPGNQATLITESGDQGQEP